MANRKEEKKAKDSRKKKMPNRDFKWGNKTDVFRSEQDDTISTAFKIDFLPITGFWSILQRTYGPNTKQIQFQSSLSLTGI